LVIYMTTTRNLAGFSFYVKIIFLSILSSR